MHQAKIDLTKVQHIEKGDAWTLLICTLRYSYGRTSYITGEACELVLKYRHLLRPDQVEQLARETETALKRADGAGLKLGHDVDHEAFIALVKALRKKAT